MIQKTKKNISMSVFVIMMLLASLIPTRMLAATAATDPSTQPIEISVADGKFDSFDDNFIITMDSNIPIDGSRYFTIEYGGVSNTISCTNMFPVGHSRVFNLTQLAAMMFYPPTVESIKDEIKASSDKQIKFIYTDYGEHAPGTLGADPSLSTLTYEYEVMKVWINSDYLSYSDEIYYEIETVLEIGELADNGNQIVFGLGSWTRAVSTDQIYTPSYEASKDIGTFKLANVLSISDLNALSNEIQSTDNTTLKIYYWLDSTGDYAEMGDNEIEFKNYIDLSVIDRATGLELNLNDYFSHEGTLYDATEGQYLSQSAWLVNRYYEFEYPLLPNLSLNLTENTRILAADNIESDGKIFVKQGLHNVITPILEHNLGINMLERGVGEYSNKYYHKASTSFSSFLATATALDTNNVTWGGYVYSVDTNTSVSNVLDIITIREHANSGTTLVDYPIPLFAWLATDDETPIVTVSSFEFLTPTTSQRAVKVQTTFNFSDKVGVDYLELRPYSNVDGTVYTTQSKYISNGATSYTGTWTLPLSATSNGDVKKVLDKVMFNFVATDKLLNTINLTPITLGAILTDETEPGVDITSTGAILDGFTHKQSTSINLTATSDGGLEVTGFDLFVKTVNSYEKIPSDLLSVSAVNGDRFISFDLNNAFTEVLEQRGLILNGTSLLGNRPNNDIYLFSYKSTDLAGNVASEGFGVRVDLDNPNNELEQINQLTLPVLTSYSDFSKLGLKNISGVNNNYTMFATYNNNQIISGQSINISTGTALKLNSLITQDLYNNTIDGNVSIEVKLVDKSGKMVEYTWPLVLDTTAPIVRLDSQDKQPNSKNWFNSDVVLNYIAKDNVRLKNASIKVNGVVVQEFDYTSNPLTVSAFNYNLSPDTGLYYANSNGEYKVEVVVFDTSERQASTTKTFKIDKSAPSLDLSNVEYGFYYNNPPTLKMTTNEEFLPDFKYEITTTLDGRVVDTKTVSSENTHQYRPIPDDGYVEIFVSATDGAGNTSGVKSVNYNLDRKNPVLGIYGVEPNVFYNQNKNIRFTLDEKNVRSAKATIVYKNANGGVINTQTVDINKPEINVNIDTNARVEISAVATDKANNEAVSRSTYFTIDKIAPRIDVQGDNQLIGSKTPITAKASVFDDYIGDIQGQVQGVNMYSQAADGVLVSKTNNELTVIARHTNKSADGKHMVTVNATDKAGNKTSKNFSINVNRHGSDMVIGAGHKEILKKAPSNITVSETNFHNTSVEKVLVKRDQFELQVAVMANKNGNKTTYSFNKKQFKLEGVYTIDITTKDTAGNINTLSKKVETYTFTIDKTAPHIYIKGISNNIYINEKSKVVNASTLDNVKGKTLLVYVNGKKVKLNKDGNFTLKGRNLTVKVVAIDKAGNKKTITYKHITVSNSVIDKFLEFVRQNPVLVLFLTSVLFAILAGGLILFLLKRIKMKIPKKTLTEE